MITGCGWSRQTLRSRQKHRPAHFSHTGFRSGLHEVNGNVVAQGFSLLSALLDLFGDTDGGESVARDHRLPRPILDDPPDNRAAGFNQRGIIKA
jgi:hypothetical protein